MGKKGQRKPKTEGADFWLKSSPATSTTTNDDPSARADSGRLSAATRVPPPTTPTSKSTGAPLTLADQADRHACYMESVQAPRKEVTNLLNLYQTMYDRYYARHSPPPADELASLATEESDHGDDRGVPIRSASPPSVPSMATMAGEGRRAQWLREDFCGTAVLCAEWNRHHVENQSIGVDIDPQVIAYARSHTFQDPGLAERVRLVTGDVLTIDDTLRQRSAKLERDCRVTANSTNTTTTHPPTVMPIPPVNIISCLNYSLFYFHRRTALVAYLRRCLTNLRPFGIVVADAFGGTRLYHDLPTSKFRRFGTFNYYFEYRSYDLMTNLGRYAIHFEFPDGSWIKNYFSYTFRIYSLLEIKEAMLEAGFHRVHIWVTAPDVAASPPGSSTGPAKPHGSPKGTRKSLTAGGAARRGKGPKHKPDRRGRESMYAGAASGSDAGDSDGSGDGGPRGVDSDNSEDADSDDDREYQEIKHEAVNAMEQFNAYIVGVKMASGRPH
ncbi:hypothetical protein H4R33_003180 [Dimargaris cristalligena]|uniref:Uncharacterized protein n=1 Tax=Dimargaris cristalligena TaxID=215637 RepID=A0A4P9ZSQ7_9FUNG|nr:hypothetical protein H4R33_003180 [Dimargaris cristalligena]RKP36477.1 hypothetical protein BJ085DRAFT_32657 [Dimargaris cristalligena]|eukprot:RKP36477.1 hypothetical protein BJ085DRAFT_32657 [Dimargaris cristalligena]